MNAPRILVASRASVRLALKAGPLDKRVAMMSIIDGWDHRLDVDESVHSFKLHTMCFHDIEEEDDLLTVFSEDMAREAAEFIHGVMYGEEKVVVFIFHCLAGISRSAAMAAATSKVYYGDDSEFFDNYCPNRRVYRLMLEALNKLED